MVHRQRQGRQLWSGQLYQPANSIDKKLNPPLTTARARFRYSCYREFGCTLNKINQQE